MSEALETCFNII